LNDRDKIRELIDKGIPDLSTGLGSRCFETLDYYKTILSKYPILSKTVDIYHPDLQGPFDIAHLIWGHDIFLALYDCPELVQKLLFLITKTYSKWMNKWLTKQPISGSMTTHWDFYTKGTIMLRDDSAIMLSAEHYNEFVKPYDQKLLDEFGGCIHFCGRGNNFIKSMCTSKNLFAIHCSQPDLNDMDLLFKSAQSNKIVLLGLQKKYAAQYSIQTGALLV
jgi:hypothetical protein